ncbi:MAG TPA: hypothetical protein PK280_07785 [Planctomycetota bacterium]|nr:hypothetical protein [Planctomycetota bacterium]
MLTRLLPLAVALCAALPAATAGEKAPPRTGPDDDFLFDEGLIRATDTKVEKIPANPAASEGLEAREGWSLAAWEDRGTLAKVPDPNKAGNTLLRLSTEGGKMGKSGAVIGNVMLPAETGFMTVSVCNPGDAPVKIALGLFQFGDLYYETSARDLPPGGWQVLRFDLAATDFKCAASNWKYAAALPKRVPVRTTVLLLIGDGRKVAVFYDGVSLDSMKLPELRNGAVVQFGKEPATGQYAGYVASASAQEFTVASDAPAKPADRELQLQARSGGKTPEAYYFEFVDRSVFRQLMPGDAVQVGWCLLGGARRASWINLVAQFPRKGRIVGRVRSADASRGSVELEMTAVPAGYQYMTGKVLAARMPLNSAGAPDPERAALMKLVKAGMQIEIDYEHSAEYGVLIRSLRLPGGGELAPPPAPAPTPAPPPPPVPAPPPPAPKDPGPEKPGGDSDY